MTRPRTHPVLEITSSKAVICNHQICQEPRNTCDNTFYYTARCPYIYDWSRLAEEIPWFRLGSLWLVHRLIQGLLATQPSNQHSAGLWKSLPTLAPSYVICFDEASTERWNLGYTDSQPCVGAELTQAAKAIASITHCFYSACIWLLLLSIAS